MKDTIEKIEQWAHDRNIIHDSDAKTQFAKLVSEVGELGDGIIKWRPHEIKDGIGDCVVVLTILAAQCGMTLEGCVEEAYDEIKDRKGRMVNGTFIKEGDA